MLVRHSDIKRALSDKDLSNEPSKFSTLKKENRNKYPAAELAGKIIPFLDPPKHPLIRHIVAKAFQARFKDFEKEIETLANNHAVHARKYGAEEAIKDVAAPFSLEVMSCFLGIPSEDSIHLKKFVKSFFYLFAPITDPDQFKFINDDIVQFIDYFRSQLEDRKVHSRNDLITDMMQIEFNGKRMTDDEVIGHCILLFADGVENIQYGIGNILVLLNQFPEVFSSIGQSSEIAKLASDEAIRLNSPAQIIPRIVRRETSAYGKPWKIGTPVFLAIGSANLDEDVFEEPTKFAPSRDRSKVLTFGYGNHSCIGGRLANIQMSSIARALSRHGIKVLTTPESVHYLKRFSHRWPTAVSIKF